MSAPTAPSPATNHSPSESEKPSHASSLAGPKDEATTTAPTPSPGLFSRKWALGPVVKDYGDYGLLACSFVTGMVDGASFLNWGVFVGMQTGEFFLSFRSCHFLEWSRSIYLFDGWTALSVRRFCWSINFIEVIVRRVSMELVDRLMLI
jgi:hypothetical protein